MLCMTRNQNSLTSIGRLLKPLVLLSLLGTMQYGAAIGGFHHFKVTCPESRLILSTRIDDVRDNNNIIDNTPLSRWAPSSKGCSQLLVSKSTQTRLRYLSTVDLCLLLPSVRPKISLVTSMQSSKRCDISARAPEPS